MSFWFHSNFMQKRKFVTCLAVLLSFASGRLHAMSLEDREVNLEDYPEEVPVPRKVWVREGEWEPQRDPLSNTSPFLYNDDDEEPAIDPAALMQAAMAMRKDLDAGEADGEEAEEAEAATAARRRPRSHVRDVTPQELQELLGEAPRRKKAAGPVKKSDLLRQYLQSALEKKEKAAAKRKKRVVKRGAIPPEVPADEEGEAEAAAEPQSRQVLLKELLVANALLNAENGYLTDALNAATIAQTNGNDRAILKKEMAGIENAEKIQVVMEQLKQDQRKVDDARKEDNIPEAIDETVVVTDNSIANLDACPAVRELSTGCRAVIEAYRFSMDQDAIDACDAHNVCYGCSSTMRSTRQLCDQIFLAQSNNLCTREADRRQCEAEAGTLLRAMRSAHEDTYLSAPEREKACNNPCVDAFFSAVYRPRR